MLTRVRSLSALRAVEINSREGFQIAKLSKKSAFQCKIRGGLIRGGERRRGKGKGVKSRNFRFIRYLPIQTPFSSKLGNHSKIPSSNRKLERIIKSLRRKIGEGERGKRGGGRGGEGKRRNEGQ